MSAYEEQVKEWNRIKKRKGYVYVIGFFFPDYFEIEAMDNIFYVGMCEDPKSRLPSHPKRLVGAKSKYIEFHSIDEAAYAEKVLISHFKPEFNKLMHEDCKNDQYSEVLKLRSWEDFKTYDSKDKKTAELNMDIKKPKCFESMLRKNYGGI